MDDTFVQIEARYCPPLDPALLSAILLDYDLHNLEDVESASNTLDALKESALLEEEAGFDASGTCEVEESQPGGKRPESCPETSTSHSPETDVTSVSSQLEDLNLNQDHVSTEMPNGDSGDLEKLDHDTKVKLLQDLFGEHFSRYGIEHTLRKCNGNWNAAMEELLNHVYFGESDDRHDGAAASAKGIDAFAEENIIRRGRKGKAKNKRLKNVQERRSSSLPALHDDSSAPATNKWESAADDIQFIASRTGISPATVSSLYYEKAASVSQTIGALLKASMEESKHIVTDETAVSSQANELGREFPTVAPDYVNALVRLTHPSTTAAHELAKALTAKPKISNGGGIEIVPRFAHPGDMAVDSDWDTVAKRSKTSTTSESPSSADFSVAQRRDAYALARAAALSKASAAHRKAKSDRLMGGAAAYYGQVGREYAGLSASASAQAADQLAGSQSTPTQLDLHGVDVLNAVRIAQEKVEEWWDGLGESRVNGRVGAEDRQTGYRIVVGIGRHSDGGKGKLGPAISKMLRLEGWKIEPAGPVILVKGPVNK